MSLADHSTTVRNEEKVASITNGFFLDIRGVATTLKIPEMESFITIVNVSSSRQLLLQSFP